MSRLYKGEKIGWLFLGICFFVLDFFLGFLVPCFLLFCFSLLLCFSAFLLFCLFASPRILLLCFLLSAFPCFCASLLSLLFLRLKQTLYSSYEQATCCVCLMSSLQGVHGKYLGSLWEFAGSIYGYDIVYIVWCVGSILYVGCKEYIGSDEATDILTYTVYYT